MVVEERTDVIAANVGDERDERREQDLPTLWIVRPSILLLGVGATLVALSAILQYLGNHSGTGSPKDYYYADAAMYAVAYGCVATGFFVSWIFSGRSRVTRDFSFAFMLAFVGAACVATQWICTFIVYVLDFTTKLGPSYAARATEVKRLVDASAFLQIAGWGAIAGAIFLAFLVIAAKTRRSALSSTPAS
jgi:hypothetical protein